MKTFFNIRYEFDRNAVHSAIAERLRYPGSDYICVADGVILNHANRDTQYLQVVNDGLFSICDSSYVPLYIKLIHGEKHHQYCGSQIFYDIVNSARYRMIFLGAQQHVLDGLQHNLAAINPAVRDMRFEELPFLPVEDFNYSEIAHMIENDGAEIIWVALGAPKQEQFMNRLKPHLNHGVMIAVGAAFKFYSGTDVSRAPQWMVRHHMEFIHRLIKEPRKQIKRCSWIIATLPSVLWREWRKKSQKT